MFNRANRFINQITENRPWSVVISSVALGGAAGAASRWVFPSGDKERTGLGAAAASLFVSALTFAVRTTAGNALISAFRSSSRERGDSRERDQPGASASQSQSQYNQQAKEQSNVKQPEHR